MAQGPSDPGVEGSAGLGSLERSRPEEACRASEPLFLDDRQGPVGHLQRQAQLLVLGIGRFDIRRRRPLEDDERVRARMLQTDQIPALLALAVEIGLQLLTGIILRGLTGVPLGGLGLATALLAMLPPAIVVVLMQKWFVKGLVDTEK